MFVLTAFFFQLFNKKNGFHQRKIVFFFCFFSSLFLPYCGIYVSLPFLTLASVFPPGFTTFRDSSKMAEVVSRSYPYPLTALSTGNSVRSLMTKSNFLPLWIQSWRYATQSWIKIWNEMINVVWSSHYFEDNFGMKHKFAKYLNRTRR